ncbi:Malate/L-lactate dehydrogenase [Baffinella frigidus]|nr:Malate/L-lactate dehydrogenase [Cryptophyta sp. CCMP2293]
MASWHGIKTHNAIKALHLDDRFGSRAEHPGCDLPPRPCVPKAQVEVLNKGRFGAVQRWNANKKLGQSVAFAAMEECMRMADTHGVGIVTVDNCFHYLWGGGYVIEAAKRGYIAYTNCTSTLAEVVPHGGVTATLGTNPHSWGFPTTDQVGFPIVVDWATSTVAMGCRPSLYDSLAPSPSITLTLAVSLTLPLSLSIFRDLARQSPPPPGLRACSPVGLALDAQVI